MQIATSRYATGAKAAEPVLGSRSMTKILTQDKPTLLGPPSLAAPISKTCREKIFAAAGFPKHHLARYTAYRSLEKLTY